MNASGLLNLPRTATHDRPLKLLCAAILLVGVHGALGANLYVWTNSPDPQPKHGTWQYAAHSIQDAVLWAVSGDTIIVTDGVYRLSGPIVISEGVTVQSVNGATSTIVDADRAGCAFEIHGYSVVIDGFTIRNGLASGEFPDGGGVQLNGGGTVQNCVIVSNESEGVGGGVYSRGDGGPGGDVRNCLLIGNRAVLGGGIYSEVGFARNCTVVGNTATVEGGGLVTQTGVVENCIVWSNAAPAGANFSDFGGASLYRYTCTAPTSALPAGREGCIQADPMFIAPTAGNYRVASSSACIDAGTNGSWMTTAKDLDGRPRIIGASVDMGAYEFGWIITATAGPHGQVLPGGSVTVGYGGNQLFEISPDPFWLVEDVLVDAVSIGPTNSYLFSNVITDHTIHAAFIKDPTNYMYIATNGGHVAPYATWTTAATNLEAALAAMPTGKVVILVSNGTYRLTERAALTNGLTVRGVNGASNTIFDGYTIGGGFFVSDATLEDVTVTRSSNYYGGGAQLDVSGLVRRCTITGNRAVVGGGVHWQNGGVLTGCVISSNRARLGGGVGCQSVTGTLDDCDILNNVALDSGNDISQGGGIWSSSSDLNLRNCRIIGNLAGSHINIKYGYGGGVYLGDTGDVVDCLVQGNSCSGIDWAMGGGIYMLVGGMVSNSVIEGNTAWTLSSGDTTDRAHGGGLYIGSGTVSSCLISSNKVQSYKEAHGGGMYSMTVVVRDCVVTGNVAAAIGTSTAAEGGGIYQMGGDIARSRVVNNSVSAHFRAAGGGVSMPGGSGEISDCVIAANEVNADTGGGGLNAYGGGIYAGGPTVRRCTVVGNHASSDTDVMGGGVYTFGLVDQCIVRSNSIWCQRYAYGGGVWGSLVANSLIDGNEATSIHHPYGGGIYALGPVLNCTIVNNYAGDGDDGRGGGIYGGAMTNCVVVSNLAYSAGSNYYGGTASACWIDTDPAFVSPTVGNFRLRSDSPCIDSGAAIIAGAGFDLDGAPRPLDGNADGTNATDIGCYEFVSAAADSDGDTMRDAWEMTYGLNPIVPAAPQDDADGDGAGDRNEHVADTNPTNAGSRFETIAMSRTPVPTVWFLSSSNRLYSLASSTSLISGAWMPLPGQDPRLGSGTLDFLTDTNPAPVRYHRVTVRLP